MGFFCIHYSYTSIRTLDAAGDQAATQGGRNPATCHDPADAGMAVLFPPRGTCGPGRRRSRPGHRSTHQGRSVRSC